MNNIFIRYRSRIRNTIYHLKTANWAVLKDYNKKLSGGGVLPYFGMLSCSWQHGASFENYYDFKFYEKTCQEKKEWITTSLRHEITRQLNNANAVHVLKNKLIFSRVFNDLIGRKCFSYSEIINYSRKARPPERLVIKHVFGQAGKEVFFPKKSFDTYEQLSEYIESNFSKPDEYICEEFINQHDSIDSLNSSCVNTLRIISYYDEKNDVVDIWGVSLRLGVGGSTDNLSAGGIAAAIDENGYVYRPAVSKDPFLDGYIRHPITKKQILGFKVPYYSESLGLVKEAAKRVREVRSIGWDVAITNNGPCLIEGNDNWNARLFQIPTGHGLRHLADDVCNMKEVYD